ncbi:MAG: DUF2341 domain-containing protein [Candidatus Helarchaeota archaeon]
MKKKSNLIKGLQICLVLTFFSSLLVGIYQIPQSSNTFTMPTFVSEDISPIDEPTKTSDSLPVAEWWDADCEYRKQINITNQYDYNLQNYSVYFQFNYTELVSSGKMRSDLKDIRIVQNGSLLRYYFVKDSPTYGIATVWFESNVTALSSNYYTYMYYGNESANVDSTYYDNSHFGMLWYQFEDQGSSVARDIMGKYNGTIHDVGDKVNYVAGYMGQYALDFADTQIEAYIDVPYQSINGLYDFTICFWATSGNYGEYLISGSDGSDHNDMIYRAPDAAGWHFYIWMRNGSGCHAYQDLVLDDAQIWNYPTGCPDNPVGLANGGFIWAQEQDSLGGGFVSYQAFSGSLDEIRIFDHGLSYTELVWLYNNYSLDVSLLTEEVRSTELTVFVEDIDGNRVPNAEVFIMNGSDILSTPTSGEFKGNTTTDGSIIFTGVPFGSFNITVNYTSNKGLTEIINMTKNVDMVSIQQNITIETILWTITFNVTDIDLLPMETGWIIVKNYTSGQEISNVTVNSSGWAIFRWLNHTLNWTAYMEGDPYVTENIVGYNFSVYYNNSMYNGHPLLVNESTVPNIALLHQNAALIYTNLTRLYFYLYSKDTGEPLRGAEIQIVRDNNSADSVVNLTATNGYVTFRWLNREAPLNYTMKIWFYSYKQFNITDDTNNLAFYYNFSISSLTNLSFAVAVDPGNFKTELISKNPSTFINTYISYDMEIYVLYNITSNPGGYNGTSWADTVTWTLKQGTTTLDTGTFEKVLNSQYGDGLYFLSLNTLEKGLNDSSKIYTIEVSASKSGFGEPQNLHYTITVDEIPTQFEADRDLSSPIYKYWNEEMSVLFTYFADVSEETNIEDSYTQVINQSSSINFEPYITAFTNYYNLTGLYFNFTSINEGGGTQWPEFMKMNITIGSHKFKVYNGTVRGTGYSNLTEVDLNWFQTSYQFGIESSPALDNFSVQITAYFDRWYTTSKMVITDSSTTQGKITIDAPGDNRNLEYVKFEFYNIKNQTDALVNATDGLMNISIPVYNDVLSVMNTGVSGQGILELSNYTLFSGSSVINFTINSTNLKSYSVNITAGFESTFEKHNNFEKTQTSITYIDLISSSLMNLTSPVDNWNLTSLLIRFENLNETVVNRNFYPSQANLTIWVNGVNYIVQDTEINGTGYVVIPFTNEIGNKTLSITFNSNLSNSFTFDSLLQRTFQNQKLTPISGADVIWQYLSWSGDLTEVSAGNYNFTLNTSILLPTTETKLINIVASKQFHEENSSLYIKLILNERPTLLNNSKRNFYEIQMYALDVILISFNYTDELTGEILKSDANGNISATFTWYRLDDPENVYSGNLTEVGNCFVLDFDTELKSVGKYVLGVNIKRDNYTKPQMTILITISQRPISITVMPPVLTLPQRQSTVLVVSLKDSVNSLPLSNFNVTYLLDGIPLGKLLTQADGKYLLPIDTSILTLGAHYIIIQLEHDNYTMPVYTVSLTVNYAQIFGLDEPVFYTIIIAAVIAIAAVSVYVSIKRARVPYVIKKIDETIKAIEKNKPEIDVPVMKTKEKIFLEKFSNDWGAIDLQPPITPTETMAEFKDLIVSMKSIKMTEKEIENLKMKLNQASKEEGMKLLESMGIPPDASERLIRLAKR